MKNKYLDCKTIAAPFGHYSHVVETSAGMRTVHVAGQVGAHPDGSVPNDASEQTKIIFSNIEKVLAEVGMSFSDIVKMNYFVVNEEDLLAIRAVRDTYILAPYPAASLVLVKALGQAEWRLEIECVASAV